MGRSTMFLFVAFLAALTILPSGLALPSPHCGCHNGNHTHHSSEGGAPAHGGPSLSYSLSYSYPPPMHTGKSASVPEDISTSPSSQPVHSSTPVLAVIPSATPPASKTSSSPSSSPSASSDVQKFLDTHNSFRAQYGASPLVWNDALATKAQQWASHCEFKHSNGALGPYGENLAAGTGSGFDVDAAVKLWTDEASSYDPNNPVPSHFTQVVWKSTTELGCVLYICNNSNIFDLATYGPTRFVVCEYSPPGNVIGEFSQNVQAKIQG